MSYNYQTERPNIFTEDGADTLMKIRENARKLVTEAGAVCSSKLLDTKGVNGDMWLRLACMDYLCEKKYLHEVTGPDAMGQRRVFVAGREWA